MKEGSPQNVISYILRRNRPPVLWVASSIKYNDEVLRVNFKYSGYKVSLRDPFNVVDKEGNVIFTITDPQHIAIITANMLTINQKEDGSLTKERMMEFIRDIQQTPVDPQRTFSLYASSDTIEQFHQELKKYTDGQS